MSSDAVWIFGYGSLVWRPAFAHRERRPAWIRGFSRRFWQGSTDHRGVPGAPGRVVTLTPEPEERCWGMAYRVDADHQRDVLAELDHREKGGYERRLETLHLLRDDRRGVGDAAAVQVAEREKGAREARALVYIATPENPNYLGPAPLEAIAQQVRGASGPSGPNREYVVELASALRTIGARDEHVFALDALLRSGSEGGA